MEALARRDAVAAEWAELGSPLLTNGSMGQLVEHPLVKMLREHEVLVARLGELVRKRHRGPQPSAVLGASLGKSGSARLRLAKAAKAESA
jgi:hypothetical protein